MLTGNDVGATDGFLITNSLTGGSAPVSFIDTDTDGTSGDSAADNADAGDRRPGGERHHRHHLDQQR